MIQNDISFRPITDEDKDFLYKVFFSTRIDELAYTEFSDSEKDDFLRMQFRMQHTFYMENYTETDFLIIMKKGFPIGRIYLSHWKDQIRIVDIALLPEYRNNGIGTRLIKDVMEEARCKNIFVSAHVEKYNPALRLYDRLGFKGAEDREVYLYIIWVPDESSEFIPSQTHLQAG